MARITTVISEMFGIEYPVIGAPMFKVSSEDLAIAVSEAGGLGCISLTNYATLDQIDTVLSAIRRRSSKPIGVNIHLSDKFDWRSQLRVCLDRGVNLFITSLGDPKLVVDDIHNNGGKVFTGVIYLKHARKAEDCGVDGLIAIGAGAGGHGGRISTMVLVPYLCGKVSLPIIAAGGISTGAQMAAAFALGASAVVVGTRLIATPEANSSGPYKDAVVEALPEDIVFSDKITGNYASWIEKSIEKAPRERDPHSREWKEVWSAGQSVAQVDRVMPAAEIIAEMVEEYERTLGRLPAPGG